jgi:hypothetical protein
MRSRKLFKRVKPHWLAPKKNKHVVKRIKARPHAHFKKPKKINIAKPPRPRVRKVHAPKRSFPKVRKH